MVDLTDEVRAFRRRPRQCFVSLDFFGGVFGVGVFGVALALSGVLVAVLTAPDKTKKRAAASPGKIKISYYTYPPASAASAARSFAWSRSGQ